MADSMGPIESSSNNNNSTSHSQQPKAADLATYLARSMESGNSGSTYQSSISESSADFYEPEHGEFERHQANVGPTSSQNQICGQSRPGLDQVKLPDKHSYIIETLQQLIQRRSELKAVDRQLFVLISQCLAQLDTLESWDPSCNLDPIMICAPKLLGHQRQSFERVEESPIDRSPKDRLPAFASSDSSLREEHMCSRQSEQLKSNSVMAAMDLSSNSPNQANKSPNVIVTSSSNQPTANVQPIESQFTSSSYYQAQAQDLNSSGFSEQNQCIASTKLNKTFNFRKSRLLGQFERKPDEQQQQQHQLSSLESISNLINTSQYLMGPKRQSSQDHQSSASLSLLRPQKKLKCSMENEAPSRNPLDYADPLNVKQQQQQQQYISISSSHSNSSTTDQFSLKIAKERRLLNRCISEQNKLVAYRCHVCGSGFEDRHRLQQHLSIHLNLHPSWFEERTITETMAQYESKRGDYLCRLCSTRFDTTAEFDKHMQLHGDKPHKCELCDPNKNVSFRYYRQLLTHLRSHCFLYSCRFNSDCKQTANRKDYLKLHILKHHLNNKLPECYAICCH